MLFLSSRRGSDSPSRGSVGLVQPTALVTVLFIVACSGSKEPVAGGGSSAGSTAPASRSPSGPGLAAPQVTSEAVVGQLGAAPLLFVIDDKGVLAAAGPTNPAELTATYAPVASKRLLTVLDERRLIDVADSLYLSLREGTAMKGESVATILSGYEPPPPRVEPPRDAGPEKLTDAARQNAIDAAKMAGVNQPFSATRAPAGPPVGEPPVGWSSPTEQISATEPQRDIHAMAGIEGTPMRPLVLVIAAPATKAALLTRVLGAMPAALGVRYKDTIRPLRFNFAAKLPSPDYTRWIEVRVTATSLAVEAVPNVATTIAWASGALDMAALSAAHESALRQHSVEAAVVDVLVDPAVDMQRLTDVLVALDTLGVQTIGFGRLPIERQAALRNKPGSTAGYGIGTGSGTRSRQPALQPQMVIEEVAAPDIKQRLESNAMKLRYCYEKALLKNPVLAGTVELRFTIEKAGAVADAGATGVDGEVSRCVAQVIGGIEFPRRAAATEVTGKLTFRPR